MTLTDQYLEDILSEIVADYNMCCASSYFYDNNAPNTSKVSPCNEWRFHLSNNSTPS